MQKKQMELFNDKSIRGEVIRKVHGLRKNWIEIGEALNSIAFGGDFKDWGYDDFTDYCLQEVGIKISTAQKMISGYRYLKEHGKLDCTVDESTVTLLERLERSNGVAESDIIMLRDKAFDGDYSTEKELQEKIKTVLDAHQKSLLSPAEKEFQKIIVLARKLKSEVGGCRIVPDGLKAKIKSALDELDALNI